MARFKSNMAGPEAIDALNALDAQVQSLLAGGAGTGGGTAPAPAAPGVPGNVTASSPTAGSMAISWGSAANAAGYNVYRGATKINATPISGFSTVDTGLTAATQYSWTVKAVNSAGVEGGASSAAIATTAAATSAPAVPAAPASVSATTPSETTMLISWGAVASATSYNVYRGAAKVNAAPVTALNYTDTGLSAGTAYTWAVRSVSAAGEGPVSATANGTTTSVPLEASVTSAFAFEGGKIGAWLDIAPANLRQGTTKASAVVTADGQRVGRIVDRSANDNDAYSFEGGASLGTYRQVGTQYDVKLNVGLSGLTGGGSGEGTATSGFAASMLVSPEGYYNTLWTDASSAFTGREIKYDSDENGFVFSVGTGTARVRLVVAGLGTQYVAPPVGSRWRVDVWHEGTTLSMRVDGGAVVTATCPAFAVGSPNYILGSTFANLGFESGGYVGYLVHVLSPLTATLRDGLSAFVQTRRGTTGAAAVAALPMPTITTATSPATAQQIGDPTSAYFVLDNRWNQGSIVEGAGADQFMQEVGVVTTAAANGSVAFRLKGRWPNPAGSGEVKAYPEISVGKKPGYYSANNLLGGTQQIRLPNGTISTAAPSGGTPGTFFPQQMPLSSIKARTSWAHNATPTGEGQLVYDIWLQNSAPQTGGFPGADITHEIMIPLTNWGNYGAHPGYRNPGWYDHDVVIGGILWHIYVNKGTDGRLLSNFAYLNGAYGRSGWKFIVFVPDVTPVPQNAVIDLAAMINYLSTRSDSAGTKWVNGNEHMVGVELGIEPKVGTFDMTMWDYQISRT